MNQGKRSERSRRQILEAALGLFSHQGYRGTTVREIANRAGVSTGNVYHHFPDKESIFRTLLDQYWTALSEPDHPFNRALAESRFPSDLESLALAARDSVQRYRRHVALIYVDVVEFQGQHIRTFYSEMGQRFADFVEQHGDDLDLERLRPEIPPDFAMMLVSRIFLQYFAVEILFGVHDHFGRDSSQVVRKIVEILRRGMLRT